MIGTLINLMVILPLIVGIISVDISGNPTSIREFLKSDLMGNLTSIVSFAIPSTPSEVPQTVPQEEPEEEIDEEEKEPVQPLLNFNTPETDKIMDDFVKYIGEGVVFIVFQIKDFGIWLGINTAPLHYALAVLIAFSFLSPYNWLWIGAIFWVVITERKEVYKIFKSGITEAHLRKQVKSIVIEVTSGIKNKVIRKK